MKIAQGYNPDRVREYELGVGYRCVPRKYLKGQHDLGGVAEAWDGVSWDEGLDWATDVDTHRTTLTNAMLGLRRKKDWIAPEYAKSVAAEWIEQETSKAGSAAAPVWRPITEAERVILKAARKRNAPIDWKRFQYKDISVYSRLSFEYPLDGYTTTLTPEEVRAYAFRPVTQAELETIRANRERVDVSKFRHNGSRLVGYFHCPPEHYSTSMTPEEIADLKWRDLTDGERTALRELSGTSRSQFRNTHFRHNGLKPWYVGTCIFATDPVVRYQTDLTEAEVAALVKPPEPAWRQLNPEETNKLRYVGKAPVEFEKDGEWFPATSGLGLFNPPDQYRTSLTPDEMAKWIEDHVPAKPTGAPATKAESKQLDATLWRPITEDERKKLEVADKSRFDWKKFQHHGRMFPGLDFKAALYTYTTTLTSAELVKLVEVWRPLSLAEVKIMRKVAESLKYDPKRFRTTLGGFPHTFKTWDFVSSLDYQTTYTEQEIADLL